MLCRRYGVTAPMLTTLLKCYPAAARTANRFGKLPLHFLARNPSLTKELLAILLGAFSGADEVIIQAFLRGLPFGKYVKSAGGRFAAEEAVKL
jgi:hypothetical protein